MEDLLLMKGELDSSKGSGGSVSIDKLESKVHELQALVTIVRTTRPCPKCGVAIEKSVG